MKAIVLMTALLFSHSLLADCVSMTDQKENIVLTWTAYKTPAKAGVSGTFKKIDLKMPKSAKSIDQLMAQTSFTIDAKSVFTKNGGRDIKLAKHFFNFAADNHKITGRFISMKENKLVAEITMNNVTKKVPMKYVANQKVLTFVANGHIDVLDFMLSDQLSAINKACSALHSGKTWNDVALKLEAKFTRCKK